MTQMTTLSGAALSPLCFGTMQFGGKADETASLEMYQACRAAGVNQFDTAYVYTGGASETILGQALAQEREQVFVATKAAYDRPPTAQNIRETFDTSRERLGIEQVDLLYLHRWSDEAPLEETFETLAALQAEGLIRNIGVSNYAAWQVMKAQAVAAQFGTRIDAVQPMYNLVKRQAEVELLPMAQDQDIAVFPYSPLGGGLLTGKYASGEQGRLSEDERYAARYGQEAMHEAARQLLQIAAREGCPAPSLAVAWAARHPGVRAPIISARSVEQLQPSLAPATLSDALYDELTALIPSPPPATDRLEEI